MPTSWEPASVASVTLSGGNLVATNTGTTATNQGAHGVTTDGQTAGKFYFEGTWTTITGGVGSNFSIGVGATASTYTNMGNGGTTGVVMYVGGSVYSNGGIVSSSLLGLAGTAWTAGNTCGIALDLDNRKVWFRLAPSGSWNAPSGTANNPATNTGGLTVPAGTMVPFVTFGGSTGAASSVFTANFGASAFSGAVPSGFTSGWPTTVPNTTWSTTDKSAGITLSNGNLTAAGTAVTSLRAIDRQFLGKFYFEHTLVTANSNGAVGLVTGTAALGTSTPADPSVYVGMTGTIWVNNASTGIQLGSRTTGDVIGIAVDLTAKLIWFRVAPSGNWNNSASASPGTGTGGVAFGGGGGIAMFPWAYFNGSHTLTANFGDTAFTGAVPSGFTAGWPAGVTSVTNALATQVAAEQWVTSNPPAQITQVMLEQWASVANYVPPAFRNPITFVVS